MPCRIGVGLFIVLDVLLILNFKHTKILGLFSQDRVESILQGKNLVYVYICILQKGVIDIKKLILKKVQ